MTRVFIVLVGSVLSLCLAALPGFVTVTAQTEGGRLTKGTVRDGRYHHARTGITIAVPGGWEVVADGTSSDGGEMVTLLDAVSESHLSVWMIAGGSTLEAAAAAGPADWFRHVIGMKIRMRFDQGLRDYWVPANTIQEKTIGNRPALAAVGEFTERGQRMAECLTWIAGDKTWAFLFDRAAATQFEAVRARFDEIVATAVVP